MKFFILFFVVSFSLFPQQSKIDSLENLLKTAKQDTGKVSILNKLFYELRTSEPDKAENYAKQSLSLSEKLDFKEGIGNALSNLGIRKEQRRI